MAIDVIAKRKTDPNTKWHLHGVEQARPQGMVPSSDKISLTGVMALIPASLDDLPDGLTRLAMDNDQAIGASAGFFGLTSSGFVKKVITGNYLPDENPGAPGLYATNSYFGFHSGNGLEDGWSVFIKNDGKFMFKGDGEHYIVWDGSVLRIAGRLEATEIAVGSTLTVNGGIIAGPVLINPNGIAISDVGLTFMTGGTAKGYVWADLSALYLAAVSGLNVVIDGAAHLLPSGSGAQDIGTSDRLWGNSWFTYMHTEKLLASSLVYMTGLGTVNPGEAGRLYRLGNFVMVSTG